MVQRHPAVATVLTIGVVMSSITCDRYPTAPSVPAAPSPPTVPVPGPESANVSGTVWIHDSEGVQPYAGGDVFGWVETAGGAGPLGRAVTDQEGKYLFKALLGSRVRIFLLQPAYQPCAVTVEVTGDVTRDVHAVSDRGQLGVSLPPQFLSQSPTLSGVVFEDTPDGRRGLSDVHVGWDSSGGGDFETATTLSDSEGRYVLCGLDRNRTSFVSVSKAGYQVSGKAVVLTADTTTLDIQVQRR